MHWEIAANMIWVGMTIGFIGMAMRRTRYRAIGSVLVGLGGGVLGYALIAPWMLR